MLTSIAIVWGLGLIASGLFKKIKLPGLLGMILVGIILSPHALNILDPGLLNISADLRKIALVIILTRAGLSLDLEDLKRVGRPAVLMCFVPATVEIIGTIIIGPMVLPITHLEAAIIGSVIAAVSPAVVVPRMINLMEGGWGKKKSIPQLILAGSSVDDVFVIVMFTALTSLAKTGSMNYMSFLGVPVAIAMGIVVGIASGWLLLKLFQTIETPTAVKIIILFTASFALLEIEQRIEAYVPMSALLAIMSLGIFLHQKQVDLALELSDRYNGLWQGAEIFLFVLVGATVDLKYAIAAGVAAVVLVLGALVFRMFGVSLSLFKTPLNIKERYFCMVAYTPKATVQAAIGAIPLSMGLPCGQTVLTVAVLSILITAPFGAICIDHLHQKLLSRD